MVRFAKAAKYRRHIPIAIIPLINLRFQQHLTRNYYKYIHSKKKTNQPANKGAARGQTRAQPGGQPMFK